MILADSSIWIDHIRSADPLLENALQEQRIACHPMIIGEIAMGSLSKRAVILRALGNLAPAQVARHAEVLRLIEDGRLFSLGLGFIDAHLLASALLTPECKLWTRDRRLEMAAVRLGIAAVLTH